MAVIINILSLSLNFKRVQPDETTSVDALMSTRVENTTRELESELVRQAKWRESNGRKPSSTS